MKRSQLFAIVATIGGVFAVTFAFLWWQNRGETPPTAPMEARLPPPMVERRDVAPPVTPPAAERDNGMGLNIPPPARSNPQPEQPQDAPGALAYVPTDTFAPGWLPISFHIMNRRQIGLIAVRITNMSVKPLSLTISDVSALNGTVSSTEVQLGPREERVIGVESGLVMAANDRVVFKSPGMQEQAGNVP